MALAHRMCPEQTVVMAESGHTLLVVGDGDVATALGAFADRLDWTVVFADTVSEATAALGQADSVVVVSHHDDVDGPVLAAAVSADLTYVAAMGSRATQSRRRAWMLDNGVPAESVDAIHGPAGLDIGADTPAEIAVSMLAEIIAVSHTAVEGPLRDRAGPIH